MFYIHLAKVYHSVYTQALWIVYVTVITATVYPSLMTT